MDGLLVSEIKDLSLTDYNQQLTAAELRRAVIVICKKLKHDYEKGHTSSSSMKNYMDKLDPELKAMCLTKSNPKLAAVQLEKLEKRLYSKMNLTKKARAKTYAPKGYALGKKSAPRKIVPPKIPYTILSWGLPMHFLFESAAGYALFDVRLRAHEVEQYETNILSADRCISSSDEIFKLMAFRPFLSASDALIQMNAIINSKVTEELQDFLRSNLPKFTFINKIPNYNIVVSDARLVPAISTTLKTSCQWGVGLNNIMRGLRLKCDKLIGWKSGALENAQLNLARLYNRQRCTTYEEEFISVPVQDKDKIETEYKLWNPYTSKLAAAIKFGLTNLFVKPGSRVLYLGDVCGIIVSELSDLVGLDGLVYAVGLSDNVNKIERRSNVITIYDNCFMPWKYRMMVGMVDVIFVDSENPSQNHIPHHAEYYLKAEGKYIISTRTNNIDDTTGQVKDPIFSPLWKMMKSIEQVKLEPMWRDYVMVVGCLRMPEE